MPLRYQGEIKEHQAVREKVGLFDLSHMGEFLVRGRGAAAYLQRLLTNDLARLTPGRAQYTFLLNPQGGILDDLIVYQLEPELFLLVVNAANIEKDWAWLQENHPPADVELQNISEETVLLALSGLDSTAVLAPLTDTAVLSALPYYGCYKGTVAGIANVLVATTGYTGEWTYELFVRRKDGTRLWEALMNRGAVQPAGLAARNTLRLEMGYLLYGQDVDEETTPLEAGAGWAVKLDKGDFIGRETLLRQKAQGVSRKLVGLVSESPRAIPREGMALLSEAGEPVGRITSGTLSPTLQRGIALGYVPPSVSTGEKVWIDLRRARVPLTVTRPPFVSDTSLLRRQKARL